MSGEYYCNEEPITKFYKEYENNSPKSISNKEKYEPKSQDLRLHDIEEQLEMAESRCNTLKDQLDYMKQIYGVNKTTPKSRKISNITTSKKSSDEKLSGSSFIDEPNEKESRPFHPKRQNSNSIGTDNTGAAVRTINNIINGITDSVNRLSELHVQISESPRSRKIRSTGISPHPVIEVELEKSRSNTENVEIQKNLTDGSGVLQDFAASSTGISNKSKNIRRRIKDGKLLNKKPVASLQSIRRSAKLDKRNKNNSTKTSIMDKTVPPMMKRRFLHSLKPNAQTHKLIEIYHNNAAKNSDSDEAQSQKNRQKRHLPPAHAKKYSEHGGSPKSFITEVPPLNISEKPEIVIPQITNEVNASTDRRYGDQPIEIENFEPPQAPRTEITTYSKNYELPTIASRMKQVAKSYLNSFSFKTIPFCAAISTTPSHNIGINIQQVMNILKTRQPINGISPTLAHNIGLAADRLNSRPLSALVSTINSKTCYKSARCPLSKTLLNYQQLQEMARGIPEETAEEMEDVVDSPTMKTMIITGPSGDMEVQNRNVPIWAVDPSQTEQCTCFPQSGVEFQQVANKYRRNGTPLTALTMDSQVENGLVKYTQNKRKCPTRKIVYSKNGYNSNNFSTVATENQQIVVEQMPLQGKERNLKEVLTNLHNEFEYLNKRYEEVAQRATADDEGTLKDLEKMETELNKKEEEITMVMNLYKEVIALKEQIKSLKQRTSQASVNIQDQKEPTTKFKEYNNPQAAFHLTKLLRQIQHYQMRYKRDVNGV